jgi:hypothetical protein
MELRRIARAESELKAGVVAIAAVAGGLEAQLVLIQLVGLAAAKQLPAPSFADSRGTSNITATESAGQSAG